MINTEDFIKRLQKIIGYYNLSASAFADKVGVPRSSISHILSGRNKPSLEFIMKILSAFPDVDLYWLLNGKGSFPSLEKSITKTVAHKIEAPSLPPDQKLSHQDIDRVIIFYKDGSFKNYSN